jgi:hypothetical protein
VLGLTAAGLVALGAGRAAAQPFDIELQVSEIGQGPGGIDPRAGELNAALQKQFRYESLRVLETRKLRLGIDEVGSLELPNGNPLRVRPLQLTESGLLLAAQVGGLQTDLKLRNGHLVVLDAGRHGEGKLVVSLKPRW